MPWSIPGTGSGTSNEADRRHPREQPPTPPPAPPGSGWPGARDDERRPAIGGAAAWRAHPDGGPVRPREELDAPERTRYGRKPLREQLTDWVDGARAHPIGMLAVLVFLGGWLFLRVVTPDAVRFERIEAGDCLYVRTGSADLADDGGRPIGSPALVRAAVLLGASEPASCDASHGHEVAAIITLPHALGEPYPGEPALLSAAGQPCATALAAHVGGATAGPALDVTTVVPDGDRWRNRERRALCLVHRADGQFLDRRAGAP